MREKGQVYKERCGELLSYSADDAMMVVKRIKTSPLPQPLKRCTANPFHPQFSLDRRAFHYNSVASSLLREPIS